jgi:hypothetical protein
MLDASRSKYAKQEKQAGSGHRLAGRPEELLDQFVAGLGNKSV